MRGRRPGPAHMGLIGNIRVQIPGGLPDYYYDKEGGVMAPRLTDKQKKRIIADYVNLGSYNAVGRLHGISATTVKNLVLKDAETVGLCEQKKTKNTMDMLAFMESRKKKTQDVIDQLLNAMPQKIDKASLVQLGTVYGILVDKTTGVDPGQKQEEGVKVIIDV